MAAVATPVLSIVEMRVLSVPEVLYIPVVLESIFAPLATEKEVAAVVCAVPSLNTIPLEPSFIPVARAIEPVENTEPEAGYVTKTTALPER